MASAGFKATNNGIENALNGMMTRANTVAGYLDRVIFRKYQKAQIARWQSQNSSEGDTWRELTNKEYIKRKAKKFPGMPLMYATGKLFEAASAQDSGSYYKIVSNSGIRIGVNSGSVPYAKYAGAIRPFMKFADSEIADWRAGIKAFIAKGRE